MVHWTSQTVPCHGPPKELVSSTDCGIESLTLYCQHHGNVLHDNARIVIGGVTEDVLVERCKIRNNDVGIDVKSTARGVLLRDNQFEAVSVPVQRYPSPIDGPR